MSGLGRELGIHGLEEYQEVKQININLTPGVVGWLSETLRGFENIITEF